MIIQFTILLSEELNQKQHPQKKKKTKKKNNEAREDLEIDKTWLKKVFPNTV